MAQSPLEGEAFAEPQFFSQRGSQGGSPSNSGRNVSTAGDSWTKTTGRAQASAVDFTRPILPGP